MAFNSRQAFLRIYISSSTSQYIYIGIILPGFCTWAQRTVTQVSFAAHCCRLGWLERVPCVFHLVQVLKDYGEAGNLLSEVPIYTKAFSLDVMGNNL